MQRYNDQIIQIEALKLYFEKLDIKPEIQKNILRNSLLKSARFSSKIEGANTKLEINNLYKAYSFIASNKSPKNISLNLVKQLHKIIMNDITAGSGNFRTEPCAIYNTALENLVKETNTSLEHPLINAAIFQFKFEKIHPFLDGNGRIGRLISYLILYKNDLSFKGYLSPEEYISKFKEIYYDCLDPDKNYHPFVKYFLDSIENQIKTVFDNFKNPDDLDTMLPRRKEIYETIKDHPYCSFDFICRRFASVNPKTLHYDLQKLQKDNLIKKIGISRGVTYISN